MVGWHLVSLWDSEFFQNLYVIESGGESSYCFFFLVAPKLFKDAIKVSKCKSAMEYEYAALLKNQTWVLVNPSTDAKVYRQSMGASYKKQANDSLDKNKTRLVAPSYFQTTGLDYI